MRRSTRALIYLLLTLGALVIALPIYLTVVSVFKTRGELAAHFFALPQTFNLENLRQILRNREFYTALTNSTLITTVSLAIMSLMLPMLAYPIARRMNHSRPYRFMYYFILAGLFIPFQVRMMPLIRILNKMGLLNQAGVVLVYLGYSACEGVFLFASYLGSISEELEESATIDGANTTQIFFKIVFPLLRPMSATVLIKNTLWVWNDFFMPMLVLNKAEYRTLPLFQYNFQSEFAVEYPLVFTTFFLSMIPIMLIYIVMQRQIIGGMMTGAMKG